MNFDLGQLPIEFWIIAIGYYFLLLLLLKQRHDNNNDICLLLKVSLGLIFVATPLIFGKIDCTSIVIIVAGLIMGAICDIVLGLEKTTGKKEYTALGLVIAILAQSLLFIAVAAYKFDLTSLIVAVAVSVIISFIIKNIFNEKWLVWLYQTIFFAAVIYGLYTYFAYGISGIGILVAAQILYLVSAIIILTMRHRRYYFHWDAVSKVLYYTAELTIGLSIIFW